ncbi:MAG TPA: family 1 glycosylhydrolase, partial [Gemmatimonadales bacterium]
MAGYPGASHPDLWGGIECTVNRVGDNYFDQLERSGHAHWASDLDRIAALGIKTLRYPLLWERIEPDGIARADWEWADQRLSRLKELDITPIVGLIHHGSGPRNTNLLDPSFPLLLAEYAAQVARRYPHLAWYTPVNEPLTTARFSALYGHWYPHARDPRAFARALLNQCRGTVLAMERIREVNPAARLVQTDDLGKVFSTRLLAYQAKFENERRWLTFDLLCGRVRQGHPLWKYLRYEAGVPADELQFFVDHPCPPDIIGVNYYLTSERLLDDRFSEYPAATHGGNGRHIYADVEAVRLRPEGLAGPLELFREAWERYELPLVVT